MEEPDVTSGLSHASVNFPQVLPPEQGNRKNKSKHTQKMKILLWTLQTCRKPEKWRLASSRWEHWLETQGRGRSVILTGPGVWGKLLRMLNPRASRNAA